KDFKGLNVPELTTDMPKIQSSEIFKESDEETKQSILNYDKNGYIILKNYLSPKEVDAVNEEIEQLLKSEKVKFRYRNKIMFAIKQSALLSGIGNNTQLKSFLSLLFDGKAKLFQSINFLMGSEQKTHSDSIHMTTFPYGGLLGVWIALEDIGPDNGPLHYYPGSHKLPYYLNSDYDNEGNAFLIGDKDYTQYELMMEQKIQEQGLQKEIFYAKKGDLLIWHANLFHGGEAHLDKTKTRKSMVFHYFNENCVCYHEITQRPSLF
ncbi:MAG: phytanoyl-CoA dioxygenase family protein, partial [Bacteroidetes bacterium]|nr:phytanoyl-CoA dioxygenase family protein [Bacteroidota bacterium]